MKRYCLKPHPLTYTKYVSTLNNHNCYFHRSHVVFFLFKAEFITSEQISEKKLTKAKNNHYFDWYLRISSRTIVKEFMNLLYTFC